MEYEEIDMPADSKLGWSPERKVVAAAVATLVVFGVSQAGLEVPPGVEGAVAVLVGYFTPNQKS